MRIMALIKRIFQQMLRDKRTLALLFFAPLLILTLMYFFFNGEAADPELGVTGIDESLVQELDSTDIQIEQYNEVGDPEETVVEEKLDGMLYVQDGQTQLILENSDPTTAQALQIQINQAAAARFQAEMMERINLQADAPFGSLDTTYVYGSSETVFFDVLSPILVGFFVFFFVFLISGIGLLKERTSGTLDRLMSTPIRRGEIVTAYLIGFGFFAVLQTVIVVFYSVTLLDMVLVGSIWNVILVNLLLALVALSLGTLLSSFAGSEFQMVQFIPLVIVPQFFFSGIIPLEGMAGWLQQMAKIMPIYYGADALKAVMYQGLGFNEIRGDLLALALFAIVFITLNVFALKKYRKL